MKISDTLLMHMSKFSEHQRGILFKMLMDAYSTAPEIVSRHRQSWRDFDNFVYDNPSILDKCGFVTVFDGQPVGFVSWDPRKLPESIEIGHNCVLCTFKGRGIGLRQLNQALEILRVKNLCKILVKTGNTPFFLPARKMYESAGFTVERITKNNDPGVPEVVEYCLKV